MKKEVEESEKTPKEPFRIDKLIGVITIVAVLAYAGMIAADYMGFDISSVAAQISARFTKTASADTDDAQTVSKTSEETTAQQSLATTGEQAAASGSFTVCIDAALGGSDSGASANGLVEKNVTLSMAKKIKENLENSGVKVVLTRDSDKSVTNEARVTACDNANSDLLVSLRLNSAENTSVRGYEIWVSNKKPTNAVKAAETIDKSLSAVQNIKSRGVKYGTVTDSDENYYVNAKSKCASLVIQLGFITNTDDAALLKSSESDIAQNIAQGIVSYLNTK